jgi:hypothetical protein
MHLIVAAIQIVPQFFACSWFSCIIFPENLIVRLPLSYIQVGLNCKYGEVLSFYEDIHYPE